MELILSYDMRAPDFGARRADLYAAALDQVAWADELGFDTVGLGEHHGSEDGYLPSPIVLITAMAARTKRIRLRPSVMLAPLYDPVRLAEDLAIAQIVSDGRVEAGLGGGYRPSEFETYGRELKDRWKTVGEVVEFLRLAWTGQPFEWQGRRCHVTPAPDPPPPILLGGSTPAAARRAARIADGWLPPLDPRLWQPYRDACVELGKPDPGTYPAQGPIFLWVSEDPASDWPRLIPHIRHQAESYVRWTEEAFGRAAGPYAAGTDEASLRASPAYRVLTPDETVALAEGLGPHSTFYLNPLLSGIEPERSWKMLRLYERSVHPHLARLRTDPQPQVAS